MYRFQPQRILIPVDFSETSQLAIKHGLFLARYTKAELYLLHVVNLQYEAQDLFLPYVQLDRSEIENKAMAKLDAFSEELLHEYGVTATCLIRSGSPSFEILSVASEYDISLIVMGTHGYGPLEELIIGSVALKVLTKSPCPTMAMNVEASHIGYKKILMPIDTSAHTRQKVNYTLDFARDMQSQVEVMGLLGSDEANEKPAMGVILKQVTDLANERGVKCNSILLENVKNRADATIEHARAIGADLMVIMSDQDAELTGLFLGPYAQQIIHASHVPVIALKPRDLSAGNSSILGGTSGL